MGERRLRDRPAGEYRLAAGPELQQETDGGIDRSEVRDSPWNPLAGNRSRDCLELASRKPCRPAAKPKATASTGRTYGCKRSDQTIKNSCSTGAVHIWIPGSREAARPGMTNLFSHRHCDAAKQSTLALSCCLMDCSHGE